jgi:Transposase DDE domain
MDEPARRRARKLANTPEFAKAQRERKKVEALFAELNNQSGLRRLRLRRLRFVREQFFLAAAAQNLLWKLPRTEVRRENSMAPIIAARSAFRSPTFSTPTPVFDSCGFYAPAAHSNFTSLRIGASVSLEVIPIP